MKKLIIVLIALLATGATFAQTAKHKTGKQKMDTAIQVKYTCSMHPDVVSNKPGKCSKCGMDLVKMKPQKHDIKQTVYTCTMHPDVVSNKPGNCPKCGMALVKKSN